MEVWSPGGLGDLESLEARRPPVGFTDAKACGLWYSGGLNDTEAYGRPGVIGVL